MKIIESRSGPEAAAFATPIPQRSTRTPLRRKAFVIFARFCFLLCVALSAGHAARAEEIVDLGILSFRDLESTRRQWTPLADYLSRQVPGHRFVVRPYFLDDLSAAVAAGQVDFVLTQPEHYVLLRSAHRLAAVATLAPRVGDGGTPRFGGVIVARAGRSDLRALTDLRDKVVVATHANSLGSYRLQQWTLHQAGVHLPDDIAGLRFTGQPQDRVIDEILAGRGDVGFVRTGLIESLIDEGKLAADALQVINPQTAPNFPLRLSTELFPEWPFSTLPQVPDDLARAVTLALLGIAADDPAARAGRFHGFLPTADYSRLESMMLELGAHPERLKYFDARDIVEKYPVQAISTLAVLLLAALFGMAHLVRSRRRLAGTLGERAALLDSLGEGIYGIDAGGRCSFVNPKALELLGRSQQELLGADAHALFHHSRPNGSPYPAAECPVRLTLDDGQRRQGEDLFFRADGSSFPVSYVVTPTGRQGAVVTFRDISEPRRAEEQMRIAAIAFETQEAMVVTDARNRILRVNRAFTEVTGYSAEEAIGQTPSLLKSGYHDDSFYLEMWHALQEQGHWRGEIWNRRKNGEVFPEWLTISTVRGSRGEPTHFVASFLDITQRKEAEEQIEFLAYYDSLTHLPNRRLLNERLDKALIATARHRRHAALLFIDLDNFKTLNDTMGHAIGDQLLREVALRLRDSVRSNDTVARLGGDEFVILLEELGERPHEAIAQVEHLARSVLAVLGQPHRFGEISYRCTASIGAVPFRGAGQTVESLLKSADLAMYKAKEAGKNALQFFDPAMQTEVEERAVLEHELHQALDAGQFVLYYQPQVDRQGRLFGAEALLRWQHPTRGLVAPGAFIPLAEETRLILPIGQWVLEAACRQLAAWQAQPETAGLSLAINVSALQFRDGHFVDSVARALSATAAPARRLKLEITESLLFEDSDAAIERMQTLKRKIGVGLSLDDFGTGYSSLSYLKQLPLDQIKIDRSFVSDIGSNANDAAIADAVIALGRAFGLTVVAEGVETVDQRDALLARGCDAFQGFLYGRPLPIAEFDRLAAAQRDGRDSIQASTAAPVAAGT
ncbi:EAL domain-containing protein [Azonexus sp.]|uniref:EAL domain-containing protein n=1 Tax=Azonexus sp. TaxID=1872668 RepID=UPI0035B3A7C0